MEWVEKLSRGWALTSAGDEALWAGRILGVTEQKGILLKL